MKTVPAKVKKHVGQATEGLPTPINLGLDLDGLLDEANAFFKLLARMVGMLMLSSLFQSPKATP